VKRLEQTLNKPIVVLVVGVVAVALNVLLYFGYFLPRMTPLVEQVYSIGTSLPEAIGKPDSETGSEAGAEVSGKSGSETGGGSVPEESLKSISDASPASPPNPPPGSPSGSHAASPQPQQQSSATLQSPAGPPPPELPPLPTPSQDQY
jgi:hypothetical protein